MKERRLNEIKGVILVAAGLIVLASLLSFTPYDLSFYTSHPNVPPKNLIRATGANIGGLLFFLFGWSSYCLPLFILFLGYKLFKQEGLDLRLPRAVGLLVLLLSLSSLIGLIASGNAGLMFSYGGFLGFVISGFITTYFGKLGGYILFSTLIILSLVLVTDILISSFFRKATGNLGDFFSSFSMPKARVREKNISAPKAVNSEKKNIFSESVAKLKLASQNIPNKEPVVRDSSEVKLNIKVKPKAEVSELKARPQELKIGDYRLPSLDLLEAASVEGRQIKDDLASNARILEETLEDFGIQVKVTDIERGPVITRYELEPAPGVKLNKIVALGDDIALTMKAASVRIIAPIPGKGRVGVEVPNSHSSLVSLKDVLASNEFQGAKSKLTLALGKDIAGRSVVADLGDMPHLLIAVTTGHNK